MPHDIDHDKDELIELLWHLEEKHELTFTELEAHPSNGNQRLLLEELTAEGMVAVDGNNIRFTDEGWEKARNLVRRHRLAERLIADVMGKDNEEAHEAACEFEHMLAPEVADSICILLGHPRKCPHGKPIPQGACCKKAESTLESAVLPLSRLKSGQSAKIASINTDDESRMLKIMAMGLTPGVTVLLRQKFPSLVLQLSENQIALDESVADEINVWRA